MKQRSNDCYALITPELIFNLNKNFKCAYTPWIYIFIRLDYIPKIKYSPEQFFKIDRKPICEFFDVDRSTVSRAFKELVDTKLIEEQNRKYKIPLKLNDTFIKEIEGYPEYIMVNNNFLIDFNLRMKSEYEKSGKKDRTPIKVLEVFHYLITKNHHIMVETPILTSKESADSINKSLSHDKNCIKNYLGILQTMGYIEMDEEYNIINTVYGYGKCQPFKKNTNDNKVNAHEIHNQKCKEIELLYENKEIESSPTCDEFNVVKIEEPKSDEINPDPITDRERIDYLLMISEGDDDKMNELLKKFKISEESVEEYIEEYNRKQKVTI